MNVNKVTFLPPVSLTSVAKKKSNSSDPGSSSQPTEVLASFFPKVSASEFQDIQEKIFGNPVVLIRNRPENKVRKEFEKIHLKLLNYNTKLLISIPKNGTIKRIASFLIQNSKWFILNSEKTKRISSHHFEVLKNNLHMILTSLQKIQSSNLLENSSSINSVLKGIFFTEELNTLKVSIKENPEQGYIRLAEWINSKKIPLQKLNLTKAELKAVAPHLTHVSLGDMPEWDSEQYNRFLQSCVKITALEIHTNTITQLPEKLKQLVHLNCKGCRMLGTLPSGMTSLQTLDCSNSGITILPAQMKALQILKCKGCPLESLPMGMQALQELNCTGCKSLNALSPDACNLRILICDECPALKALPDNMNILQELHCTRCMGLTLLPVTMIFLQTLVCVECPNLKALPQNMRSLKELHCNACLTLPALPGGMIALQKLYCKECISLERLPSDMIALKELHIRDCYLTPPLRYRRLLHFR